MRRLVIEAQADKNKLAQQPYQFKLKIGTPITGYQLIIKRYFDVVIGGIGALLSLPIILLFAVLIKATSPGPVFYQQERVGRMGRLFMVIKLRSMVQDAEVKTGMIWAQKDDPRVTKVGRFMRKTRIDELPQLWNVLRGDMSLVGPRPERPMLTEKFSETVADFSQRLRIIPGITGYAQINGGYDITPAQKCKLDNYYIENYSLWFDVQILVGTVKIIFSGDGAR